jgi:hypothetical protein
VQPNLGKAPGQPQGNPVNFAALRCVYNTIDPAANGVVAPDRKIFEWMELSTPTMKLFLRVFPLALMLIGASLLFERPAYGYADPGTGLLAIQAVGSALVAAGWYLRKKLYSLFHRSGSGKTEPPELSVPKDSEGSPLQ